MDTLVNGPIGSLRSNSEPFGLVDWSASRLVVPSSSEEGDSCLILRPGENTSENRVGRNEKNDNIRSSDFASNTTGMSTISDT